MEGDPRTGRARGKKFIGLEKEGEGLGSGSGADMFDDLEAADNLVLCVIGERIGEECIEPFVDSTRADDAARSEKRAEGKNEALRGVKEENGIKSLFIEREEGFLEGVQSVDVGIVFEDLEADRVGQRGDVGIGKRAAQVLDGRRCPQRIAEGGGGHDQKAVLRRVFGDERAEAANDVFEKNIFHGLLHQYIKRSLL